MLSVSILGNTLAWKGEIRAVKGTITAGEIIIRTVQEFQKLIYLK